MRQTPEKRWPRFGKQVGGWVGGWVGGSGYKTVAITGGVRTIRLERNRQPGCGGPSPLSCAGLVKGVACKEMKCPGSTLGKSAPVEVIVGQGDSNPQPSNGELE